VIDFPPQIINFPGTTAVRGRLYQENPADTCRSLSKHAGGELTSVIQFPVRKVSPSPDPWPDEPAGGDLLSAKKTIRAIGGFLTLALALLIVYLIA